jgi:cytoskeletal protein RodZ
MNETGKILKSERLRRNLSIEEVSKATSIRTHIIEAIENGEYNVLPEVYIKSFIRKLCNLYEISDLSSQQEMPPAERKQEAAEPIATAVPDEAPTESADLEVEKPATKPIKKKKEKPKKIVTSTEVSQSKDYTEIFRKRRVRFSVNPVFINYIIISAIAIFLLLVIYFVFFSIRKSSSRNSDMRRTQPQRKTENNIENKLTEFFNKSDSIVIKAVARDTAWMRIEIDGARSEELLMYPEWSAAGMWANLQLFIRGTLGQYAFIEMMNCWKYRQTRHSSEERENNCQRSAKRKSLGRRSHQPRRCD